MKLTRKTRKIYTLIIILSSLVLLASSFLPFLPYFGQ